MAQQKETYKGFEIVVESGEGAAPAGAAAAPAMAAAPPQKLTIDGMEVDVTMVEPNVFITSYLPHTAYQSPVDLAKAVIDHTEEFNAIARQRNG
jgi:hypothetical protein